ncbi:MAG: radical SAM protein [archaeon]
MKISNIRLGHSNNSSSTHSIIIIPNKSVRNALKDELEEVKYDVYDHFIIKSPREKIRYLASQLYQNIYNHTRDEYLSLEVISSLFNLGELDIRSVDDLFNLPTYKGGLPHLEFIKELTDYICDHDEYFIIGERDGNLSKKYDVDKYIYEFKQQDPKGINRIIADNIFRLIARKCGDWWTLINRGTGTKIKFTFNDNAEEHIKSEKPELVDLKITDYCGKGCNYCYQDSTVKGKHADIQKIIDIILNLNNNGNVLEIALGGGEPFSHPNFWDIAKYISSLDINLGVSTRDISWAFELKKLFETDKHEFYNRVNSLTSVAFSIDNKEDIQISYYPLSDVLNKRMPFYFNNMIYFQYVLGSNSIEDFEEIIKEIKNINNDPLDRNDCKAVLTLLGWKHTGRGTKGPKYNNDDWVDLIQKYRPSHVGIDTCVSKYYEEEIRDKIPNVNLLMYTEEGKHSMYIDAVEDLMGPSSYHKLDTFNEETWLDTYARY